MIVNAIVAVLARVMEDRPKFLVARPPVLPAFFSSFLPRAGNDSVRVYTHSRTHKRTRSVVYRF